MSYCTGGTSYFNTKRLKALRPRVCYLLHQSPGLKYYRFFHRIAVSEGTAYILSLHPQPSVLLCPFYILDVLCQMHLCMALRRERWQSGPVA